MLNGFYRRRRGILEHLQTGTITLFDAGVHDFLCLNAQSRVGIGSTMPPGIWIGSATKIWLLTSRSAPMWLIKRSLSKLARIGWIKRFHSQGQRGDYPILIARFYVTDDKKNDFVVDAERTSNWQHPVLEPIERFVPDRHLKRISSVPEVHCLLQDLEKARKLDKKPSAPAQAPSQEAVSLATLLKERILGNNSMARITSAQEINWAREVDFMMRREQRTEAQIRDIIEWSQRDSFWRTNILSMGKVREKFDQLTAKKNANGKGGLGHAEQRTINNLRAAGFVK
jgi:hypothetical protein